MTGAASKDCRIVNESLSGERETDEQTFASLAILSERLEHLKKFNGLFANVGFSPDVKRLNRQANAVPVG